MTATRKKTEKRAAPRAPGAANTLTKRERFVAESAVEMVLQRFNIKEEDLIELMKVAPVAINWFNSMKQKEEDRSKFFARLKSDVIIDIMKFGGKGLLLLAVGWIGWSATTWFHQAVVAIVPH